ncbi:MAG: alpha-L-fucosidase [Prevotellaceae bacterium]|jgi:alpha-L-fucosidase|nr:alpha-L-fucosidase [Prevotellaceae bacterium]
MKTKLFTLCLLVAFASGILAQSAYRPTEAIMKARSEFQDRKFGIFIHWGIYAMLATGEWTMNINNLNYKEYAQLAGGFYPSRFNADEWVSEIAASGAKYICITSRHHDGFSMFDTKYSDFNIMTATPFKRDILKELADACQKHGIKLHFYYSLADWSREDYPWGTARSGRRSGRPNPQGNWAAYYQFMKNQLTELLTNYGPIGAIWFDGNWDQRAGFDWGYAGLYSLIHTLQPSCLVANNHHGMPLDGEDIQVFERDLPGENHGGYSEGQGVSDRLPLETCETMNTAWGYKIDDFRYKTKKETLHLLIKAAGKNANLLLNIGPRPDGTLPDRSISLMKEVGEWMKANGETIYGTRAGSVAPHEWGVTMQKGNKTYVHILSCEDKTLFLPGISKIKKAASFADGTAVRFTQTKEGVILTLPATLDEIDTIIELTH